MKQYPSAFAVETAAHALEFCIITRSRVSENGDPVICCPPPIYQRHRLSAELELAHYGLYNDVIDDAILTAVGCNLSSSQHLSFPRVSIKSFEYTADQYTDALQNLFRALTVSDEKE